VSDVLKAITKEYGDNVLIPANSFLERPRKVTSISPCIDMLTGGGIQEGSWVILNSPPKQGKTISALYMISKLLQNGYNEAFVFNIEGRLQPRNLSTTKGLDLSKVSIIESTDDKILSSIDFLMIAEKLMMTKKDCVFLFDSFSALVHHKELEEGVGTSTRGGGAMHLSQFCHQMGTVVPVKRHVVIGVTQIIANTSGFGASTNEKGGNAIKFQVDVKLRSKGSEYWRPSEGEKPVGKIMTWEIESTNLGEAPPGQTIQSYLRFGVGIDEVQEAVILGTDFGLIEQKGAWYYPHFMGQEGLKFQGKENMRAEIDGKPEVFQKLLRALRPFTSPGLRGSDD
jgi:recombination protein RecA